MPFLPPLHPAYQSNRTDPCHQAIQHLAQQTINSALQEGTVSLPDEQVEMLTFLASLIALACSDRFPEAAAALGPSLFGVTGFHTLVAVLRPVMVRCPLPLDDVFDALVRLTPRPYLSKLGVVCWGVVGDEAAMRPLLEGLGVARIDDILLVQAVLDGALSALKGELA